MSPRRRRHRRGTSSRKRSRRRGRVSTGNDIAKEEPKSILREGTRRTTRRDKKRARTRRNRGSTRDKVAKYGQGKEGVRPEGHPQNPLGTDTKGSRKGINSRLRLRPKLRKIREVSIGARKGDLPRHSLELTDTPSGSQGNQKEHFLGEGPQGGRSQRLKRRTTEKPEHNQKVPGRNSRGRERALQTKRAK